MTLHGDRMAASGLRDNFRNRDSVFQGIFPISVLESYFKIASAPSVSLRRLLNPKQVVITASFFIEEASE